MELYILSQKKGNGKGIIAPGRWISNKRLLGNRFKLLDKWLMEIVVWVPVLSEIVGFVSLRHFVYY